MELDAHGHIVTPATSLEVVRQLPSLRTGQAHLRSANRAPRLTRPKQSVCCCMLLLLRAPLWVVLHEYPDDPSVAGTSLPGWQRHS